jgi:CBS domain-containing protein
MNMELKIPVKEIMTRDVVTVDIKSDVQKLAKKMLTYKVGSVIVTDKNQPVGIVTERDIVRKIVSRNLKPEEISIKELMTTPLLTVPSTEDVTDIMHKMVKLEIRRLPIVEKGKLVGLVTDTDLIAISAEMGNIFSDLIKMHREKMFSIETPGPVMKGICEECGYIFDNLLTVDGKVLCESCREI